MRNESAEACRVARDQILFTESIEGYRVLAERQEIKGRQSILISLDASRIKGRQSILDKLHYLPLIMYIYKILAV